MCELTFLISMAAAHLVVSGCGGNGEAALDRPNIVFLSIDTLRADRLSLYGHSRPTSPSIDKFASRSVVYKDALSQAPWTLPSASSFNTSKYPFELGTIRAPTRLGKRFDTISEVLKRSGYHTIGVVSHHFVATKHGFNQGFDVFDESQIKNQRAITSWALVNTALDRLKQRPKDKPFYLWLHLFDPHFDYHRHPEFGFADATTEKLEDEVLHHRYSAGDPARMYKKTKMKSLFLEHIRAVYDEEIAYTDHWVGIFLDGLREAGLEKSTVVVLTADHGEYFRERGRFLHDGDVYCELTHVPLVIGGAIEDELKGQSVLETVELRSLPRTMATLAGIKKTPFGGDDLLAHARKEPRPGFAYSEGTYAWREDKRTACVVHDGWKLIINLDDGRYELYFKKKDPREKKDLWSSGNPAAEKMKKLLKKKLDRHVATKMKTSAKAEAVKLSDEDEARLRALGYVE